MAAPPRKSLVATAVPWLLKIRRHFNLHHADLPPHARPTRFLAGWLLFRALEEHVRHGVLDDYLRKHCTCRRWLCLIFASRYPYLSDMSRVVRLLPGFTTSSRLPGLLAGPPAVLAGQRNASNDGKPWTADLEVETPVGPPLPAQVGNESLRGTLLEHNICNVLRSDPIGPLTGQDLNMLDHLLRAADDASEDTVTASEDTINASTSGRHLTEPELETDGVTSVKEQSGQDDTGFAPRSGPQELHSGPNNGEEMANHHQQQPVAIPPSEDQPEETQLSLAERQDCAPHTPRRPEAAQHSPDTPPNTTPTPEFQPMDTPCAMVSGKRRRPSDQTSDRPSKRCRAEDSTPSWLEWLSSAIFSSGKKQAETADELPLSDVETEDPLRSPQGPLKAGTPSGDVLRLRDLVDPEDEEEAEGCNSPESQDACTPAAPTVDEARQGSPVMPASRGQRPSEDFPASRLELGIQCSIEKPLPSRKRSGWHARFAPRRSPQHVPCYESPDSMAVRRRRSSAPSPQLTPPTPLLPARWTRGDPGVFEITPQPSPTADSGPNADWRAAWGVRAMWTSMRGRRWFTPRPMYSMSEPLALELEPPAKRIRR